MRTTLFALLSLNHLDNRAVHVSLALGQQLRERCLKPDRVIVAAAAATERRAEIGRASRRPRRGAVAGGEQE